MSGAAPFRPGRMLALAAVLAVLVLLAAALAHYLRLRGLRGLDVSACAPWLHSGALQACLAAEVQAHLRAPSWRLAQVGVYAALAGVAAGALVRWAAGSGGGLGGRSGEETVDCEAARRDRDRVNACTAGGGLAPADGLALLLAAALAGRRRGHRPAAARMRSQPKS